MTKTKSKDFELEVGQHKAVFQFEISRALESLRLPEMASVKSAILGIILDETTENRTITAYEAAVRHCIDIARGGLEIVAHAEEEMRRPRKATKRAPKPRKRVKR